MITSEFVRTMAKYNKWQNDSIYNAAEKIGEEARKLDRGAFFSSIHETLCHLLWGDMIWTSRFAGLAAPPTAKTAKETAQMIGDWQDLSKLRKERDEEILAWAEQLKEQDVKRELSWYSPMEKREVSRPLAEILVQFFNHQTHHRGQAHAMITAAGGKPDDTDLILMSMRA